MGFVALVPKAFVLLVAGNYIVVSVDGLLSSVLCLW